MSRNEDVISAFFANEGRYYRNIHDTFSRINTREYFSIFIKLTKVER